MLPDELSHTRTTDLVSSEQDAHFHGPGNKESLPQPPRKEQTRRQEAAGKEFTGNAQHTPGHSGFTSSTSDCRMITVLLVNANTHREGVM